jgi:drug/metabolite transporter (DMT)-like permease
MLQKTQSPHHHGHTGVPSALMAALLFGVSAPLAKILLGQTSPWLLAALLYLGSGLGLWVVRRLQGAAPVHLTRRDWGWLAGAILTGGVAGPVLLMTGLAGMSASQSSLLLNAESVLTAVLAWVVFKESVDRRIALGMAAIVAGALVLSWPGAGPAAEQAKVAHNSALWPSLAVLGACLAWAVDNNLTRKVALNDAGFIAMTKGLSAGATNLALALALGATWPDWHITASAAVLGFLSYGASLTLFVLALRHLGASRTGAYFSVAPFFGALVSVLLLHEPVTVQLLAAAGLMAIGVWLHLSEDHVHEHHHEPMEHEHEHVHDEHHQHDHDGVDAQPGVPHRHPHRHRPLTHRHAHFPDAHHRHGH